MQRAGIFLLIGSVVVPAVLGFFWLLGLVASFTLGGFIHILLVLAILLFPAFAIAGIVLVIAGSRKS